MKLNDIAVNNLRVVSAEMSTKAKSGHPGIALGSAPILYSLYSGALKFDPTDPDYFNRDRFIMSAGHGSSILYSTLSLFGFNVSKEDLMNFRQLNSVTPGHPEYGVTEGVDCSTGPLGQGIANAVGMAIAQKHLAATYNKENMKIIDNHIFALCGEGCLMEGISYEALSLAGTLNLNNLTIIYDRNNISIEGDTTTSFNIDVEGYFTSLGFKVYVIKDGNNVKQIASTLSKCKKELTPTVVICNTVIGYGSEVEGLAKSHGSPLSEEQIQKLREKLKITTKPFEFDTDVKIAVDKVVASKKAVIEAEKKVLENYKNTYPEDYEKLTHSFVSLDFTKEFKKMPIKNQASRDMSHECLQIIAEKLPNFIGGCADLATSTKAFIKNTDYISKDNFAGRNIHFGIREHAMGAICNGMALCGVKSFASTFMSFSNYMFPAMRMACLDKLPVLYIFSHDSFMVGEDGPTHQAIEQLISMRSIPELNVFRPFNAEEMKAAFIYYLENATPTVISTSKNNISDFKSDMDMVVKGGYTIKEESKKCQAILVATGMEVDTALKVQNILLENYKIDIRVVSMPNMAIFERQTKNYISRVFPQDVTKRIVLEPASKNGWAKIVGKDALFITRDEFGKSAKAGDLAIEFGFDPEQIAERIKEYVKKY